jgi:hypothetical protein
MNETDARNRWVSSRRIGLLESVAVKMKSSMDLTGVVILPLIALIWMNAFEGKSLRVHGWHVP